MLDRRSARKIAEDPYINHVLWLIHNGIPYDVAFSLPLNQLKAWAIIFSTFNGREYDWDKEEWVSPDQST